MFEAGLEKIAETILSLDEASLSSLWNKYKSRMENFDTSKDWEKAVIIFFIINAVRVKNNIFNEQLLKSHGVDKAVTPINRNTPIRLIK